MRKIALALVFASLSCGSPTEDDTVGFRLEGRVETAAGAPVAGYLVKTHMFTGAVCTGSSNVPNGSDVTDANGRFAFNVQAYAEGLVCIWPHTRPDASSAIAAVGDSVKVMARVRPFVVVTDTIRLP